MDKFIQLAMALFAIKYPSWVKAEKLEIVTYSPQAFYTLRGVRYETPMTRDHTGAILIQSKLRLSNDPIYRIIQNLRLGQRALHNIRLRFEVKGIFQILSFAIYRKSRK